MKVALTGAQNTGKTTFLQDLLTAFPHFSTPTETYRDVIKKHGLQINQLTGLESQRLIRDFLYDQIMSASPHTILDRCLIDNYVYSLYAFTKGNLPKDFLEETYEMMRETSRAIDHFILIPSAHGVPLVSDALRDINVEYVDTINRMFIDTVLSLVASDGIKVTVLGGSREARVDRVRELLTALQ